jgi:hypothetical protein
LSTEENTSLRFANLDSAVKAGLVSARGTTISAIAKIIGEPVRTHLRDCIDDYAKAHPQLEPHLRALFLNVVGGEK